MENMKRAILVAAVLVALGIVFTAQPAKASHTTTCEIIDGTRVCTPNLHTPPTISANNTSVTVNERQTANNSGTFSDPDGNATVTLSASVGTVTKDDANGTWSWTFNTNDGPDQSQTVTITATDGTDTVTTTFSLTVRNVAPTTDWQGAGPGLVSESDSPYGLTLVVRDPGEDGVPTPNVGCGAGGTLASVQWIGGSFDGFNRSYSYSVRCTRGDGPASSVVSASATDSDGATGNTDNLNVEVQNVAPTATINGPDSVDEGGTVTVSFTNQNDVQADRNAGLRYAFSCNGTTLDGTTYANAGTASSTTCVAGDGGLRKGKTVRARIIDKDGGFTEYTKNIVVNNVAPTATLETPASADQGSNFTVSLTNLQDPSSADRDTLSYAFDCGDGSGYVQSATASKSCTALDQPNVMVKGKVTDKDGGSNEYAKTVTVNNVAPTGTIQINGGAAVTKDATVNLTLSATDPLPGSGVGSMRFRNENTETWSAWEPYATSRSWLLSDGDGAKTVHVEYRDNAGNVSTVAIQDEIQLDSLLDTTAPNTTIASGPSGTLKSTSASFGFSSSEAGSKFQCSLDGAAFTSCASPKSYTNLKNGSHTFKVRAIDQAGNTDATPAVRTWKVDTVKPTVTGMSPRHKSIIRDTTPTIKATVKDNMTNLRKGNVKLYVAGKLISARKYSYSAATDRLTYNSPRLAKGKKTVKIVARDAAGNVGARSWYFRIK